MGRYYSGNISGKFWFAIQSSYDPQNLGCSQNDFYEYVLCGCICNNKNITYCMSCYDNEEEHKNDLIKYHFPNNSLIRVSDKLEWSISISKKNYLLQKILEIESTIDVKKYINDISFNKNDNYDYDIKITDLFDSADKKIDELLARWCLGKQILNYFEFEKNDLCIFYGEV